MQVAREADGAAKEIEFAHDGAADAPEGIRAETMPEVSVEVAGGVHEGGVTGGNEVQQFFPRDAHLLGGVVGQAEITVHEFGERGLGLGGQVACGVLASLDLAAELKFFLGAEARPTRGLVHVQRQGVRFARAFVARRE